MSVELTVCAEPSHTLNDTPIPTVVKPYRILMLARIHPRRQCVDAILDTGAMLSVIPQQIWETAENPADLQWLTQLHDPQVPAWLQSVRGLTDSPLRSSQTSSAGAPQPAAGFPCRIAQVNLTLHDKDLQPLPPIRILAKCVHDEGRLCRRILIGLFGQPFSFGFRWSGGAQPQAWIDWPTENAVE